jgi:hypothetical protein
MRILVSTERMKDWKTRQHRQVKTCLTKVNFQLKTKCLVNSPPVPFLYLYPRLTERSHKPSVTSYGIYLSKIMRQTYGVSHEVNAIISYNSADLFQAS